MRGRFITFEGVEGCGKTTQIGLLRTYFESRGRLVDVTREPGGTPIGEAIRGLLLDPDHTAMGPAAELLLYAAARAQHVHQRIRPALEAGTVVLCDRYADSTLAYQGSGRGLPFETLARLHDLATDGLWPDLTFVIDLPAEEGLRRARGRGRSDRLEQESISFHERVRQGFLRLAEQAPARIKIIDGTQSVEEVATAIRRHVEALWA